jgi:hypothetical protein
MSSTQLPAMSKKVAREATGERCVRCNAKVAFCACDTSRRPVLRRPRPVATGGGGGEVLADDETRL